MRKKRTYALLLSLALAVSLTVPAMADGPGTTAAFSTGDVAGKLVIIHTNDTHGRDVAGDGILGTAAISQLKKDYQAAGADTLLLSAGDAVQGTTLVNYNQGADAISFMNMADYDAMCVGNHEFDWGYGNLKKLASSAKFPVLGANVLDKASGAAAFKERQVFTTPSGLKVGVFGLTTPETATSANPSGLQDVRFLGGSDLYTCAASQVAALKAEGCDLIVALGHLGVDEGSAGAGCRSVDLVNHVSGIDLFIDGHSHTVMEQGKPVPAEQFPTFQNHSGTLIVSTGSYLANAGVVVYDPATKALTSSLAAAGSYSGSDEAVATTINTRDTEIIAELGRPFASSEVLLNGERAPGNRTEETNLGDFAADAILYGANKATGNLIDIAITNGGGIRESIPAGQISMLDMRTVFPFNNQICVLPISGQGLLEALEAATYCTPDALGAFPQVAGIAFTIDTSGTYENGAPYSTYFRCANPGTRIKNVTVKGQPLDLNKTYYVATNDFSAVGGDTYYAFKEAYEKGGFNTGVALEDALIDYTQNVMGGVISSEKYGAPQGRIQVIASTGEAAAPAASTADSAPAAGSAAITAGQTYTVQRGDSLWKISRKFYGTGDNWYAIYQMNRAGLADPDKLQPGQVLALPAA